MQKTTDKHSDMGKIITSTIVGVAAGVTAVALADKNNRKKIMHTAGGMVSKARDAMQDMKERGKDKAAEGLDEAKKKIKKMK